MGIAQRVRVSGPQKWMFLLENEYVAIWKKWGLHIKKNYQYFKKPSVSQLLFSQHLERIGTENTFTKEVSFSSYCVPYYMSAFIILKVVFSFLLYLLNTYKNLFQFIRLTKGILFSKWGFAYEYAWCSSIAFDSCSQWSHLRLLRFLMRFHWSYE